MEINLTPPQIGNISPTSIQSALQSWKAGEILQASVVSQSSPQTAVLRIGNTLVSAAPADGQKPLPTDLIQPNTILRLEVVRSGEQPVLKILASPPAPAVQEAALRSELPRQQPLTVLLAGLEAVANAPAARNTVLPQAIASLVKQVLQSIPTPRQVSQADGLKKSIEQSGVFLENRLAKAVPQTGSSATQDTARDLKAQLGQLLDRIKNELTPNTPRSQAHAEPKAELIRQLAARLPTLGTTTQPLQTKTIAPELVTPKPETPVETVVKAATLFSAPPTRDAIPQAQPRSPTTLNLNATVMQLLGDLAEQVEGVLSRMRVTQLTQAPLDQQNQLAWHIELPIRDNDKTNVLQLAWEKERSNDDEAKTTAWNVTLAFHFDELGGVFARLRIAGKKVSAAFTAEQPTTAATIERRLQELQTQLVDAGLEPDSLTCNHGPLPAPRGPRLFQSLIDIRA